MTDSQSVVHRCPPRDEGVTPCCGKTPFELPRTDRMTIQEEVTCGNPTALVQEMYKAGWSYRQIGAAMDAAGANY